MNSISKGGRYYEKKVYKYITCNDDAGITISGVLFKKGNKRNQQ